MVVTRRVTRRVASQCRNKRPSSPLESERANDHICQRSALPRCTDERAPRAECLPCRERPPRSRGLRPFHLAAFGRVRGRPAPLAASPRRATTRGEACALRAPHPYHVCAVRTRAGSTHMSASIGTRPTVTKLQATYSRRRCIDSFSRFSEDFLARDDLRARFGQVRSPWRARSARRGRSDP